MALTRAQLDSASTNATALSRMRGAILVLAGFIINSDNASGTLHTARLRWATRCTSNPDSAEFVAASAARWLLFSAGTSGVVQSSTSTGDLSDLTDANFDSLAAVIANSLTTLQTLEGPTVLP